MSSTVNEDINPVFPSEEVKEVSPFASPSQLTASAEAQAHSASREGFDHRDEKEGVPLQERKVIAHPIAPSQTTLLARAEADYAECKAIVDDLTFCRASRGNMLRSLADSIQRTKDKGIDDELYETYRTIDALIREWCWADALRAIFSKTLTDLREQKVVCRSSTVDELASRNAFLARVVAEKTVALDATRTALEEKTAALQTHERTVERQEQALRDKESALASLKQSEGLYRKMLLESQANVQGRDKRIDELAGKMSLLMSKLEQQNQESARTRRRAPSARAAAIEAA